MTPRPRSSLAAQISEVMRELTKRAEVYPGLVRRGRLRQSEADLCTARMEDVLATLNWLASNEVLIKRLLAEHRGEA